MLELVLRNWGYAVNWLVYYVESEQDKTGNDCKWFYVILSVPHLMLNSHATFAISSFILFASLVQFQNRMVFPPSNRKVNIWQPLSIGLRFYEADIMHWGNYRHKMNACRFKWMQKRTTNGADKHNGNENFIAMLIKQKGFFSRSPYLHTFDSHRWRFSKGKQWKCLICLLFCRFNANPRRQNVWWVLWEWNSCKYFMPLKVVASRNVIGRFKKLLNLISRIAQVTFRMKTLYGFFLGPVIDSLFRYNTTVAISVKLSCSFVSN